MNEWIRYCFSILVELEGLGARNETLENKTEEYLIAYKMCLPMEWKIIIEKHPNLWIIHSFRGFFIVYWVLDRLTLKSIQSTYCLGDTDKQEITIWQWSFQSFRHSAKVWAIIEASGLGDIWAAVRRGRFK